MKRLTSIALIIIGLLGAAMLAYAQVPPSGGTATGTGYPSNSQPVTASVTGTTGAVAATLTSSPGQTTFICGFVASSGGTTAALAAAGTITGTIGGTLNFTYVYVSAGQGLLGVAFPVCIPATGPTVAIAVNIPAGGAGTTVSLFAWGYRL